MLPAKFDHFLPQAAVGADASGQAQGRKAAFLHGQQGFLGKGVHHGLLKRGGQVGPGKGLAFLVHLVASIEEGGFQAAEGKIVPNQQIAADVLMKDKDSLNYDKVNSKAIAMGARLKDVMCNNVKDAKLKAEIQKAIAD